MTSLLVSSVLKFQMPLDLTMFLNTYILVPTIKDDNKKQSGITI